MADRSTWIVLLILFKRRARGPGPSLLLRFRKMWSLRTQTLKSIEKMQREWLTPLLRVKSGELSRYKTK